MKSTFNISTSEKIVFVLLLIFVSSILRAMGMAMSFSIALIFLGIIFFIYKLITTKTTTVGNLSMPIEKSETIKSISSRRKNITFVVFAILLLIAILFYWFQIRPSRIISDCENFARSKSGSEEGLSLYEQLVFVGDYQDSYESCLRSKGLER